MSITKSGMMDNPFEKLSVEIGGLSAKLDSLFSEVRKMEERKSSGGEENPFDEFIPKAEVRNVHLSASKLHTLEKSGRLKCYAIEGKRYYKKSELRNLFEILKTK